MERILIEQQAAFDEQLALLEPYDAQVWLGYPASARQAWPTMTELNAALAEGPVKRGLISHTMGWLHNPFLGNQALIQALAEHKNIFGVMTLLPEGIDEIGPIDDTIAQCLAAGLRAARLHPKSHRYSLRIPACAAVLAALQARGVPLLLPIGESSWAEVAAIAHDYPKLAILVESTGHHEYLNIRGALSYLEQSPNLLVPTNRQFLCGGLELMVERLGEHRVFFSSNQPIDDPYGALGVLVYSRLPIETRRRIAHQNLDRLLASVGNGGYLA